MPIDFGSIDGSEIIEKITEKILDKLKGLSEEEQEELLAHWERNLEEDVWYTHTNSAGRCILTGCRTDDPNVVLPNMIHGSTYEIGSDAFSNSNIVSITISAGVTSVGRHAFAHCDKLKKVIFADGFSGIFIGSAFFDCGCLEEFRFPSNITVIEPIVHRCQNLSSIYIPRSVTTITPYAFAENNNLRNIYFDGSKSEWQAIEKGYRWSYEVGDYTVYCHDGKIVNRKKTRKPAPPKSPLCIVETSISSEEENTEYIYCEVDLGASRKYSYITEDESIKIGDTVVVPIGTKNLETMGVVDNIIKCQGKNAPYPPSKTKKVLRKYYES